MPEVLIPLCDGVDGLFIKNSRFNTTLISFNFYLPLNSSTAAENALLPFVLSTCREDYKTPVLLNRRLCELYGARLSVSVFKVMDCQQIRLSISCINDRFVPGGESVVKESAELLVSLIFAPSFKDGCFTNEDVQREKRKCKERILSEINDKRTFVRRELIREMFKSHPYSIHKYGSVDAVDKITGAELFDAWQRLIRESYIRVNVSSHTECPEIFSKVKAAFLAIKRQNITDIKKITEFVPSGTKTVTKHMDIVQGKIAMGFTSRLRGDTLSTVPLSIMCDLFGGGTYSKLFKVVREQMGLCYYCAASTARDIGFLMVDSGVEAGNAKELKEQVLFQLERMKNGDFSDEDINASKLSICDSLKSYYDSQGALDIWYSTHLSDTVPVSPDEVAQAVKAVTREQITSAAKGIELCTIFELMPGKADGNE